MRTELGLELRDDLVVSISRNSTCIDAVFSRHIEQLERREYVSYLSTHHPLLSITGHSADSNVVNDVKTVPPIVREPLSIQR